MLRQLLAPQLVLLYILAATTIYVHFRGRQRLRIARQLGDHSTLSRPVQRPDVRGIGGAEQAGDSGRKLS
jgi:hypothetical protein